MHDFIVYLWDIHERFIVSHYEAFDMHALLLGRRNDLEEVDESVMLFPYLE